MPDIRMPRLAVFGLALALAACTARVKDEGRAPGVDVNVNADSARLPRVEVDPAKVEVGTDTHTVVTPRVDVTPTDTTHR